MRVLAGLGCFAMAGVALGQLPANYKVILDNADVQVQRVHYGPREFVPMHDHPAATTVYVYLNDSGVVDIAHEGPGGEVVHRPPTHTGALRLSPGVAERHSVQNTSDVPSDFLRVELKHVAAATVGGEFRAPAPEKPYADGKTVLLEKPGVKIERMVCVPGEDCVIRAGTAPSVLVRVMMAGPAEAAPVKWLPAGKSDEFKLDPKQEAVEILRIVLPQN